MYRCAMDIEASTLVVRWNGRTLSAEDYDSSFRDFVSFVETTAPERRVLVLIVVGRECPAPPAKERARFVEMERGLTMRPADLVYVTESTISRGVLTAVRWLRPTRANHRDASFGSLADALAWIETSTDRHAEVTALLATMQERERGEPLPRAASR